MKSKPLLLFILSYTFISSASFAGNIIKPEFDQAVFLTIDDKEFELLLGEKNVINITDRKYTISVRLAPYRTFSKAGIFFNFPSEMHVNLNDSDRNLKIWNISGDNAVIMVQEYNEKIDELIIINAFKEQYYIMKASLDSSVIQLTTKSRKINGTRLHIKLGDVLLSQDLYIVNNGKRTTVLILQDTLDEGENSAEFVRMENIVKDSFKNIY